MRNPGRGASRNRGEPRSGSVGIKAKQSKKWGVGAEKRPLGSAARRRRVRAGLWKCEGVPRLSR